MQPIDQNSTEQHRRSVLLSSYLLDLNRALIEERQHAEPMSLIFVNVVLFCLIAGLYLLANFLLG